jgi:2'-5' RNA ligase
MTISDRELYIRRVFMICSHPTVERCVPLSEQLGLPGFGRDQDLRHRLFFALLPSSRDASRIFRLAQQLREETGLKGRLVSAERLHVSLHGFGDHPYLPQRLVDAVCKAGDAVMVPPFEVAFDCAGSFRGNGGGKRPFVVRSLHDIDALLLFHRALAKAMARAGLARWIAPHFAPHMTLLYDSCVAPQRAIETVRFPVQEFVLVHSLLRQGRYISLARFSLNR